MKTVHIDAKRIMQSDHPFEALCALFNLKSRSFDEFKTHLMLDHEPIIAEVANCPVRNKTWEQLSDLLEGIQQHSNTFYLIWGTQDDMVNPDTVDPEHELENPSWALPVQS